MDRQEPTVGRIVHLYGTNPEPWAAVITRVWDDSPRRFVDLFVWPPGAGVGYPQNAVPYGETEPPEGHHTRWAWPPRV